MATKLVAQSYLVLSILGSDHPGMMEDISKTCLQCGCNILDSRAMIAGTEFTASLLLTGNWSAIAKMEAALPAMEQRLGVTTMVRRTHERPKNSNGLSYSVSLLGQDKPGIVHLAANFFTSQGINMTDMHSESYLDHRTFTRMFSLSFVLEVPNQCHIGQLREKFMLFCDEHNVDAILEPLKL